MQFSDAKNIGKIPTSPPTGAPNRDGVGSNRQLRLLLSTGLRCDFN